MQPFYHTYLLVSRWNFSLSQCCVTLFLISILFPGTNYLLDTYLGSSEEKEDSGVATEQLSSENTSTPTNEDFKDENVITVEHDEEREIRDLQDRINLLEKIVKVNKKLEKEEENLVRLFINIERCKKNDAVITDLQSNLEKLRHENESCEKEVKQNSKKLLELESALNSRKCYLKKLLEGINDETNVVKNDKSHPSAEEIITVTTAEKNFCSLPICEKPILDTLV